MKELNLNNKDVLKLMFEDVQKTLDGQNKILANHTQVHTDILVTVTEGFKKVTDRQDVANGRTTKNEGRILVINTTLSLLGIIGLPMVGWILWELIHMPLTIQGAIDKSLSEYEVKIEL